MEAFSRVKQAITQLEKSTSFIEAWNKLFKTPFDIASILYLHAFRFLRRLRPADPPQGADGVRVLFEQMLLDLRDGLTRT